MAKATMSKDEIIEAIGSMSVLELAEMVKDMEEKFGVTAAAPMLAALAAGGAAPPPPRRRRTPTTSSSRPPATRRSR